MKICAKCLVKRQEKTKLYGRIYTKCNLCGKTEPCIETTPPTEEEVVWRLTGIAKQITDKVFSIQETDEIVTDNGSGLKILGKPIEPSTEIVEVKLTKQEETT